MTIRKDIKKPERLVIQDRSSALIRRAGRMGCVSEEEIRIRQGGGWMEGMIERRKTFT